MKSSLLSTLILIGAFAGSGYADDAWGRWRGHPGHAIRGGGPSQALEGGGEPSPIVDPMGDAFNTLGAGGPLTDIDTVDVTFDEVVLSFSMSFHTAISPPSSGRVDGLVGLFEFDTDQNAATGNRPAQNQFSPPFSRLTTGADFYLDFFSEATQPGLVDVLDANLNPVGAVEINYTSNRLWGTIPLFTLGGDDGVVDFTTTIGSTLQPTDALEVVGVSVPEPSTLGLLIGAAVVVFKRR